MRGYDAARVNMQRPEETKHWLDLAVYDLETAEDMLRSGRFPYVVFFCHPL